MPPTNPAERKVDPLIRGQLSARPDVGVAEVAARQHGVVSHDDLIRCELSDRAIEIRIRNGRLHPIHRGVYAVGHPAISLQGLMMAAVKACGDASVISHYSAGALRGYVDWDDRLPDVTLPGNGRRIRPGISVHRSQVLDAQDITSIDGIPITTPTRTLIDLAAVLSYRQLRRAVRRALSIERVTISLLARELGRLRPRRGAANLARILADGHAPTRSELEDVVLDLILRSGFEMPDVNKPLWIGGRKVIPDFRWPAQRLIVEADGAAWHDNKVAREDDAERQALLEDAGERVVRVTWQQAVVRSTQTLRRLALAGAPQARRTES